MDGWMDGWREAGREGGSEWSEGTDSVEREIK